MGRSDRPVHIFRGGRLAGWGTVPAAAVRLPRLHRAGPSASLDACAGNSRRLHLQWSHGSETLTDRSISNLRALPERYRGSGDLLRGDDAGRGVRTGHGDLGAAGAAAAGAGRVAGGGDGAPPPHRARAHAGPRASRATPEGTVVERVRPGEPSQRIGRLDPADEEFSTKLEDARSAALER